MKFQASLVVLSMLSTTVMADNIILTTGSSGGVYDGVYGANLAKILKSKGHTVTVNKSSGSEDNLRRLSSKEADIGFSTVDAYALYLSKGGEQLNILANLKPECGYLVTAKNGKVSSEKDLRKTPGIKVAIGESGSGSNSMWNYMVQLQPDYKNAAIQFSGGTLAINSIGTSGGVDAVLFVTACNNLEHKLVQAINANSSTLEFIDIDNGSLDSKLPNGVPVYTIVSNKVCSGWGCSVDTISTNGAIFYREGVSKEVLETISDVISMSKTAITGN